MTLLILPAVTLLILATAIPNEDQAGQVTSVQLPSDKDCFFRRNVLTEVEYLHLKKDGGYSRIDVLDLGGIEEVVDRGAWKQEHGGQLLLVSDEVYRDVVAGPLQIWVHHKERVEDLPLIRESILLFLKESREDTFSRDRVERIRKRKPGQNAWVDDIIVGSTPELVSRTLLETLVSEIDGFLASNEKNVFHLTPMTYKDWTFLVWKDSQTPINRDQSEIKRQIDRYHPNQPTSIWIEIDQASFYQETSRLNQIITSFFDLLSGQR